MATKKKTAKKKAAKKAVKKKPEKADSEKPKPPGRPEFEIDWNYVDELLQAHCTGTQVAATLGIHPDTLYKKCETKHNVGFSEYSRQKKETGVTLLKVTQFQTALKGSIPMQIFLGKNYANQKDKPEPDKTSNKGSIMDTMDKLMEIKK